jgi:fimbrial chaperone protein
VRWFLLRVLASFITALVIWVGGATSCFAMTVSPMQIELLSAGRTSRGMISVVNDNAEPLPVELVVKRISLDENGAPRTSPAEDNFLMMPPQALIPPGATQNFRIQWLGDPLLNRSESFFIYVNQIPVKLSHVNRLQLVYSMAVMVNVAPPRGTPVLDLVSTGVVADPEGRRHPIITVQNTSTVHALLSQSTVRVSSAGWSETVTSGELAQSIGIGLVQPGHRRRFVLPVDIPATVTRVQGSLEFNPKH